MAFLNLVAADTRSLIVFGTWIAGDLIPSYTSAPPVIRCGIENFYKLPSIQACASVQAQFFDNGLIFQT
jgi:hypothetical protein